MQPHRYDGMRQLITSQELIDTDPSIIATIQYMSNNLVDILSNHTELMETNMRPTHAEQTQFGWKQFFRGFVSQKWRQTQQRYQRGSDDAVLHEWSIKFITIIHDYTMYMWQRHNKQLHREDEETTRKLQLHVFGGWDVTYVK